MADVGRVIAGVSGSPGSLVALRYADVLARAHHAILVPVLAWEPPGGDRADRVQPSGHLRAVWQDLACQRLRDAILAVWGEVPADPLIQPQVERGPAGWVLVNERGGVGPTGRTLLIPRPPSDGLRSSPPRTGRSRHIPAGTPGTQASRRKAPQIAATRRV